MTSKSFAFLLLLAAAGCGDPPQPKTPGGAGPSDPPASNASYDPAKDPLVNPAKMLQPYDAKEAAEDETLVSTLDGNPDTLNAIFASSAYEQRALSFLYNGPFTFNEKLEWMVNKELVESLDYSQDRKVWTLKLRPGFTWQDGVPFTAEDIAYSWRTILDDRVPSMAEKDSCAQLEKVEAVDDLTVRYVHKNATPTSKWDVAFQIIPKHIYEKGQAEDPSLKNSPYYSKLNREVVGSGPYRLVEWKENDKIVLERWEGYKGTHPHFKRVILRIIPDQNVQLLTFEKGETDEMRLSSKQFADETVHSETFKKVGHKAYGRQWSYAFIGWNQDGSNPFFSDIRVRKAMTMCANVPQMIEKLGYKLTIPCRGPFHPDSWMYNPAIQLLTYDKIAAGKLLDEAGWKIDPETGWRKKGDVPFSFTLTLPNGNAVSLELSAIVQQDLKSIGVEMKTQVIEWATLQERARKHEFQAITMSWGTGVDPSLTRNIFHSDEYKAGRNYVGYKNPRVDELFESGRNEWDDAKRKAIYQEIGKLIYDDQAYTFLWNLPIVWAFNNRIRGVTMSPRGVWDFEPSYNGWWVGKSDQLYK